MTIINSSGGGAPDEKPCFWESYVASGFGQEATGSGIPELQAWQEARDSGFQELQQLNFKPVPENETI